MEKYQMPRSLRHPGVCTMPSSVPYSIPPSCKNTCPERPSDCGCVKEEVKTRDSMYEHLLHLPLAMAYVPCQKFTNTYDICYALNAGTIFPELCKPFCGKRGNMR